MQDCLSPHVREWVDFLAAGQHLRAGNQKLLKRDQVMFAKVRGQVGPVAKAALTRCARVCVRCCYRGGKGSGGIGVLCTHPPPSCAPAALRRSATIMAASDAVCQQLQHRSAAGPAAARAFEWDARRTLNFGFIGLTLHGACRQPLRVRQTTQLCAAACYLP